MTDPDPITIGNATVQDVFVDFNNEDLQVLLDESIDREQTFMPVEDEPVDADTWLAEGDGLFQRYQDSPAHPPADESPKTTRYPVKHESGTERELVISFSHVTKNKQNEREPASALSVKYQNGYLTSHPTRVELAHELIERYVHGPLGSDGRSYWKQKKRSPDKDYSDVDSADVALVYDNIYTWRVKPQDEVTDEDIVFDPDETYVAVVSDEYGSTRHLCPDENDASHWLNEYADDVDNYSVQSVNRN